MDEKSASRFEWPEKPENLRTPDLPPVQRLGSDDDDSDDDLEVSRDHTWFRNGTGAAYQKKITVWLNGKKKVLRNVNPRQKLVSFIRGSGLRGTQVGCGEGGCGACTVVLSKADPQTGEIVHSQVNSCMKLLCSVDGMNITTIEGVGGKKLGYHPIQKRMASAGGSQCGFCTPGFITQMYGLLLNNPTPDHKTVENNFQGNICRCTGYRPILKAMHSFVPDSDDDLTGFGGEHDQKEADDRIPTPSLQAYKQKPLFLEGGWFAPKDLAHLFTLLTHFEWSKTPAQLIVGNTSSVVAPNYPPLHEQEKYGVWIDITRVDELKLVHISEQGLEVGGAVTIAGLIKAIENASNALEDNTSSFSSILRLLNDVATPQVRNSAGWAGNLVIAKRHPDFVSDIVTLLSSVGAVLNIANPSGAQLMSVPEFLDTDLPSTHIIRSLCFPLHDDNVKFDVLTVGPRNHNAHPFVNGGFRLELDGEQLIKKSSVILGGVANQSCFEASKTQEYLQGKPLISHTLKAAVNTLMDELKDQSALTEKQEALCSLEYRRNVAVNLFYKFFLSLQENIPTRLASAPGHYEREKSKGTQIFKANDKVSPVSQPIPKIEGLKQCAGELQYTTDIPLPAGGLYGAPVLTSQANGTIVSIDARPALRMRGVVDFISAETIEDIGGSNNCGFFPGDMPVFAKTDVRYCGQQIGMVVAESAVLARAAAKVVDVTYQNADKPPILTIDEAISQKSYLDQNAPHAKGKVFGFKTPVTRGDVEQGMRNAQHVHSGEINAGGQEHFYMETQTALAVPSDDKLHISCATQFPSFVRDGLTNILGKSANEIVVTAQRCGGAFGGKLTASLPTAAAVSIAALKLDKPVRCRLSRKEDMRTTAKREPMKCKYRVGYNDDGTIVALDMDWYIDGGCAYDFSILSMWFTQRDGDNCYCIPNYRSSGTVVRTNTPNNTTMRAPGHATAVFFTENVMEIVAQRTQVPPWEVREKIFLKDGDVTPYDDFEVKNSTLPAVWARLKKQVDLQNTLQQIQEFNANNRWRKRGLSLVPLKYGLTWSWIKSTAIVNIADNDGTVWVSHSGCEIGQGMNTKVAQAVAYKLGIPVEKVQISSTSTDKIPNPQFTGGSTTSETIVKAAMNACDVLNERLEPFVQKFPEQSWPNIIKMAGGNAVNLCSTGYFAPGEGFYFQWSAAATIAEVDVLTGNHEILLCDIVYDCGQSLNPHIDIGQVEGGYMQGLGLFTLEEPKFSKDGTLLNASPWDYILPDAHSIPKEFNVTFLEDTPYEQGIMGSKASGEPGLILGCGAFFAIRNAVSFARDEAGEKEAVDLKSPLNVETAQLACKFSVDQLTLD